MSGEKDLQHLLKNMSAELLSEEYVFCTFANGKYGDYSEANPIASFKEKEGLTLVVTKTKAEQFDLRFAGVFKCISLSVHSSLEAVGLTATVSSLLAKHQISANIIAGFYHDHIFVPQKHAKQALRLIKDLSS